MAVQLIGIAVALGFAFTQVLHRDRATRHLVVLIAGSLSFYLVFSPLLEFGPAKKMGMTAVGVPGVILLVVWARRVRDVQMRPGGPDASIRSSPGTSKELA